MELKAKRSVVIATAVIDGNEIELGHISHFVSTETLKYCFNVLTRRSLDRLSKTEDPSS